MGLIKSKCLNCNFHETWNWFISWHLLVCTLAEPAVIACSPLLPVQWDQADWLTELRPLWRLQHSWTRELRTKYSIQFEPTLGLSNREKKCYPIFFTLIFSIQAIFQSFLGNSYNHLIATISKPSLAYPPLCEGPHREEKEYRESIFIVFHIVVQTKREELAQNDRKKAMLHMFQTLYFQKDFNMEYIYLSSNKTINTEILASPLLPRALVKDGGQTTRVGPAAASVLLYCSFCCCCCCFILFSCTRIKYFILDCSVAGPSPSHSSA